MSLLSLVLALFPPASIAQKSSADLVVLNAKVQTLVSRDSTAQALAVSGERITAVGSNASIRKLIGRDTRVIDARGGLVLPGFNDAHVHFMGIGNSFSSIDLRDARTPDEIRQRIRHYVRFLPKGRWILGSTWPSDGPDRASIDRVAADNPVFVYHPGGRSGFASTLARKLSGLKTEPDEADIVSGDAMKRIAAAVPKDHTRNWPEIAEAATNYAASLGVTSIQDMHSDDSRAVYRELYRQGKLKTRVYDCISLPNWKLLDEFPKSGKATMVRGGCLKSFSDGDDEAGPALLRDVMAADRAGFQIMVHAIGNSANKIVLDIFEQATKTNGPRDRRLRIEHAQNPRLADLPRFARSGIVASMQPHLFGGGGGGYYSSLLKLKTSVAFGSDAAITDFDPLLGIHTAVNAADESISVYDAVRAYTFGSAYAEFMENEKGTIEPGKLADFVILSDDIFSIQIARVRDVSVMLTVTGGRVVYELNK